MEYINPTRETLPELLPGMALGLSGASKNEHSDLMASLISKLQEDKNYQLTLGEYEKLKSVPMDDYCAMLAEILLRVVGSEEMTIESIIPILEKIQNGQFYDHKLVGGLSESINGIKEFLLKVKDAEENADISLPIQQILMFNLQIAGLIQTINRNQVNDPIWCQIWKTQSFIMGMIIETYQEFDETKTPTEWDILMLSSLQDYKAFLEPEQVTELNKLLEDRKGWFSQ